MTKNNKIAYTILGITFVLFNTLVFAIPIIKTPSFWTAYAFTIIAFGLQIFIWKTAFKSTDTLKSKFLGFPVIHIGVVYLIVQLVVVAIIMLVPQVQLWISIVICTLVIGIAVISLVATEAGKEEVIHVDEKILLKTSYIKDLQASVDLLAESQTNVTVKEALNALTEKIRFSDPMSDDSLKLIEQEIQIKVENLDPSNISDTINEIKEIQMLLLERNKKSKILK